MPGTPPRISYVAADDMDERTRAELRRCAAEGTPRPESSSVRAHSPEAFWAFADSWAALFNGGVVDHRLKELCRVYVSRSVKCEYCGNQRSVAARDAGLAEGAMDDLLNFETSDVYDERQRAALAYAEAITWRLDTDDAFWDRLRRHFNEHELVELGCFIALTMGQQSWIRLLDLGHHQVMSGTSAAMAPGFEDEDAARVSTARPDYWAATP
ncbi:MAG: carboxymuconolactone decarboxylase family protein [Acidimicrobiales bacterium]